MEVPLSDGLLEKGVRRLLSAPLDLRIVGEPVWKPAIEAKYSARHLALFEDYKEEVAFIAAVALEWWEDTVAARKRNAEDERLAVHNAWIDRPAGPASFPGLVAFVRDYWFACDQLNKEVAHNERVAPWTFLLGWLIDQENEKAVSVLACMPYWPVGLDRQGNWV